MVFTYPAFFHKEDNAYWVEFPDLQGCQTFADSLNDARASSQEALMAYILTVLENGKRIDTPSDILQLKPEPDCFTTLISCDISEFKARSQ